MWLDAFLWLTGWVFWALVACLAVLCGLPSGGSLPGVTRLSFYEFGPVVWHVLKENEKTFVRLKECRCRFLHVGGQWYLGMSLPRWLSRRLASLAGSVA